MIIFFKKPIAAPKKVSIKYLYQCYLYENRYNLFFGYRPFKNTDLFLKFREDNKGKLNETQEIFLCKLLNGRKSKWFVPTLLEYIDFFSEKLMVALLETAIKVRNPGTLGNRHFLTAAMRVHDLAVNDYLMNRFKDANKKEKMGILRTFYWVSDRRQYRIYMDGSKETFGSKYSWTGKFFVNSQLRMSSQEFEDYRIEAEKRYQRRMQLLLREFLKTKDLQLKYCVAKYLPENIKSYPISLKDDAQRFLEEKNEITGEVFTLRWEVKRIINTTVKRFTR